MLTLATHKTKVNGGVSTTTAVAPYIRFSKSGDVPIFLQHGEFVYENGEPAEVPDWVKEQMSSMDPTVLKEAGYGNPEEGRRKR
jgi:hypothetical protein